MSEEISTKETKVSPEACDLTNLLQEEFPDAVTGFHAHRGDETVLIERDVLESVSVSYTHLTLPTILLV